MYSKRARLTPIHRLPKLDNGTVCMTGSQV